MARTVMPYQAKLALISNSSADKAAIVAAFMQRFYIVFAKVLADAVDTGLTAVPMTMQPRKAET